MPSRTVIPGVPPSHNKHPLFTIVMNCEKISTAKVISICIIYMGGEGGVAGCRSRDSPSPCTCAIYCLNESVTGKLRLELWAGKEGGREGGREHGAGV